MSRDLKSWCSVVLHGGKQLSGSVAAGQGRRSWKDFKLPDNVFTNWPETRMRAVAEADCLGAVLVSGGVCRATLGKILNHFLSPYIIGEGNFRFNPADF